MATTPRNKKRTPAPQSRTSPPPENKEVPASEPAATNEAPPVTDPVDAPANPDETTTDVTPPDEFNDSPVVETTVAAEVPPAPEPVVIVPPEPPAPARAIETRGELIRKEMAESSRRRREAQERLLRGGPAPVPAKSPLAVMQKWEIVDVTMNDYLQHMGATSAIDAKQGAAKQRALFMLIKSLLLKSNGKEGQNALFYLLTIIHEYNATHFTPLLWGRFVSQMAGSESEKQFFRIIMAVLVGLADPKGRGIYARGIDINQVIAYAAAMESIRGNVIFLQNLRAFIMICSRT